MFFHQWFCFVFYTHVTALFLLKSHHNPSNSCLSHSSMICVYVGALKQICLLPHVNRETWWKNEAPRPPSSSLCRHEDRVHARWHGNPEGRRVSAADRWRPHSPGDGSGHRAAGQRREATAAQVLANTHACTQHRTHTETHTQIHKTHMHNTHTHTELMSWYEDLVLNAC